MFSLSSQRCQRLGVVRIIQGTVAPCGGNGEVCSLEATECELEGGRRIMLCESGHSNLIGESPDVGNFPRQAWRNIADTGR
ncbi:hypothetical protein CL634_05875 [bacterium]|nr:hypothetical protein [bacterium]